jgi:outer membrane PBP1 activator LpoA protein
MVQFALAPEDEARDIAELAFGQGARSALVIRPQGEWGSKVAQALLERWQTLGGTIANSVTYSGREDYSASVKEALGIPASEQRAQAVRDILAADVEFNARRRQDIDVVFLLSSNGAEARSLKPLLAFHYAGSIPVYAISSIYSGIPDPRDRDLDGINFVETPWLLGASPELKNAIATGGTGTDRYTRLNALGADAFLVQSQFRQLQAGADALLRGNTGLLSMNPQLQIQRELLLTTFDGGAIELQ